jgi:2,3-bisphosphoglycerate-dependent phosphoglycerate mutase
MADVEARVAELWSSELVPAIAAQRRVVVFGHANCLKTLLKYIDGLSEDAVVGVKFPRATPIVYK